MIPQFTDHSSSQSLSNQLRQKRFGLFRKLIETFPRPVRILDLGGTESFWAMMGLAGNQDYRITIVNLQASTTSHTNLEGVAGNACDLRNFSAGQYDVIFSNSVIEHVGGFEDQKKMAAEIHRLCGTYFVQTPNRFFPIEPHFLFPFFQFLPVSWRAFLIHNFNLGWRKKISDAAESRREAESVRLMTKKELREIFPQAEIVKEKFFGLTKSYMVIQKQERVKDYAVASKVPGELDLLGMPMNRAGRSEVFDYMKKITAAGQKAICLNLNVYCVNLAMKHRWLYDFIKQANLVYCDGDGVRWGLKLLGYDPPEKITYNKWLFELGEFCQLEGLKIFFLGGKPGVAEEAAKQVLIRYPYAPIVGVHDGYFNKEGKETDAVVEEINAKRPDILLVCFGMPIQEKWIMENWRRIHAHIFLKGGAAFDYASGRLKKAPEWMIRMQMEWLYRFFQDPIRLFTRYIVGNPLFIGRVFWYKMTRKKNND